MNPKASCCCAAKLHGRPCADLYQSIRLSCLVGCSCATRVLLALKLLLYLLHLLQLLLLLKL